MDTDSLTAVEAELLRQRIKTKKGKNFTRFAIKAVLQNPVYMVADEDAYNYSMEKEAEVCFPKESFADVDYGDFEEENSGLGKRKPSNDFKSGAIAPQGFKRPAWRILDRLSGDLYVLSQTQNSIVRYAPLFIHSFVLCTPRKILEATQFNQRYHRYEEIDNVPDRLRWCRHSRGLMQVEVADKAGMTCRVYKSIEEGFTQHIEQEKVDRQAQFYGVPVTDFLDEFNHFLYDGQAVRIRAYRESFGMGKKPFAKKGHSGPVLAGMGER